MSNVSCFDHLAKHFTIDTVTALICCEYLIMFYSTFERISRFSPTCVQYSLIPYSTSLPASPKTLDFCLLPRFFTPEQNSFLPHQNTVEITIGIRQ